MAGPSPEQAPRATERPRDPCARTVPCSEAVSRGTVCRARSGRRPRRYPRRARAGPAPVAGRIEPASARAGRRALGSAGFPFQPRGAWNAEGFPLFAALAVLEAAGKPLTISDIVAGIVEGKLYRFNTANPGTVVSHAVRRNCKGLNIPRHTGAEDFDFDHIDGVLYYGVAGWTIEELISRKSKK